MKENNGSELARNLKNRHIQLIALGGAIGTGLFLGSAEAIRFVGPGVILSYAIGGAVIYLIMRMMGEMSTHEPVAGAFSYFAYRYWNDFAGFVAGWNYWLLYILVAMAELTAIGSFISFWLPDFPEWASALIVLVIITGINLVHVGLYGESEFWMALIKIVAIIGMILFGLILIFIGGYGHEATGLNNLWVHGGFLPKGGWGLLLSLVAVMFSFGGIELIGITAGEADNPGYSIPKAINQVIWRILVFYIGALAILVILYPWNEIGDSGSPFVLIFSDIGIPAAANLLNIVILSAAISVYNSGLYSNGRMLYNLAEQGDAPRIFTRLNSHRVPWVGVLFSSACTLVIVVVNFLVPEGAFMRIMAVATVAAVVTWMAIVLVHLKFRQAYTREQLTFPSPWYPWANLLCVAFLVAVVALMTQIDSMRAAVYVLPVWLIVLALGYALRQGVRRLR